MIDLDRLEALQSKATTDTSTWVERIAWQQALREAAPAMLAELRVLRGVVRAAKTFREAEDRFIAAAEAHDRWRSGVDSEEELDRLEREDEASCNVWGAALRALDVALDVALGALAKESP